MLGVGLDLLAQAHDPEIHTAVERIPIPLAVEIQDVLARQGTIGVLGKRLDALVVRNVPNCARP